MKVLPPDDIYRRQEVRLACDINARVHFQGTVSTTRLLQLSYDGGLLAPWKNRRAQVGDLLDLEFQLHSRTVWFTVLIIRSASQGFGFKYSLVSPRNRAHLRSFIEDRANAS